MLVEFYVKGGNSFLCSLYPLHSFPRLQSIRCMKPICSSTSSL